MSRVTSAASRHVNSTGASTVSNSARSVTIAASPPETGWARMDEAAFLGITRSAWEPPTWPVAKTTRCPGGTLSTCQPAAGHARPPHLVGLIRPTPLRDSADAEDQRSEGEVPKA